MSQESTSVQKVEAELQNSLFHCWVLKHISTIYRDEHKLHHYCFINEDKNKNMNEETTISNDNSHYE